MANNNYLYIPHAGPALLETPLLNKGSAFSSEERVMFNLTGLLPPRYETIREQVERAYMQYKSFTNPLNKHIYLRAIQDNNETLFYKLIQAHIDEMMPIIYTPTVGDACEQFSDIYRSSRGLFIAYNERHHIDDVLCVRLRRRVQSHCFEDFRAARVRKDPGAKMGNLQHVEDAPPEGADLRRREGRAIDLLLLRLASVVRHGAHFVAIGQNIMQVKTLTGQNINMEHGGSKGRSVLRAL